MSERIDYTSIRNKLVNPVEDESNIHADRISKLLTYHAMIVSYCSMVQHMKGNNIPSDLTNIKPNAPHFKHIDRSKLENMEPIDASNMLLHELFDRLHTLYNNNRELSKVLMNKILEHEILFSKYSDRIVREKTTLDVVDEEGDIVDGDFDADSNADEGDTVTGDISFEGFDFDAIDNLEGGQEM